MKFEDDDLKDGKLWAALQKEIDRDLAEKESGETFQEELADIEDSIEFESKETKSEDRIPDETANLSNLRSVLEATERAKDEEAKQKMKQTKVEPVTQDIEIPEFTEEEEEIEVKKQFRSLHAPITDYEKPSPSVMQSQAPFRQLWSARSVAPKENLWQPTKSMI